MPKILPMIILSSAALVSAAPAAAEEFAYDVVIRNGRLLDGLGNPWLRGCIAIKDGRIASIGRCDGRGRREIDAHDHYVSPGWIDLMDQSGEVLQRNGLAENKLLQGVTSAIAGEGGTPVPADQIDAYFRDLEAKGISLNFGTYYSSAQARVAVMGDGAGAPTPQQLEKMKELVATAMRAGAVGIATALIYPPDSFQSTQDLVELAKVAAQYNGIYASHMRDESAALLSAIGESIAIGEQAGIQVEIFHFKGAYQPGWGQLVPQAIALIDGARARGVNIGADMYLYAAGGTGLDITVPNWVWERGMEQGLKQLRSPRVRERLKREVQGGSLPGWSNLVQASGGWDHVVLANAFDEGYDKYRYKSLEYIGKQLGKDPADVAWDILLKGAPKNRAMALFFMMSEDDIQTALQAPWMAIGSDAGAAERLGEIDAIGLPHPRAYGNFPRLIAEYVRKRKVITLEDAVRKLSSLPATRMRLFDRGALREGLWADLTIFDFDRIQDTATYENPVGVPTGIDYVLVNGEIVVDEGKHTGAKPGKVLRGAGYQADVRL
ncbi:MAG TPA: amidohydrolase family protein [Steroidobacteraceae bacterium]|nr:amidohydrolase family protein [Steroidobacteraceae bacterium]